VEGKVKKIGVLKNGVLEWWSNGVMGLGRSSGVVE
jgi:hypothetical protein